MPTRLLLICLSITAAMSFTSCLEESCDAYTTYIAYEPVVIYPEDYRVEVIPEGPRQICTPSGFYYYQDHLMVIEKNEGLHIIDNENPGNPDFVSFLPIQGAVGLAVYEDVLYINNANDLLTFDLSSIEQPRMLNRVEEAFPAYSSFSDNSPFGNAGGIIIDYLETEMTQELPCSDAPRNFFWRNDFLLVSQAEFVANASADRSSLAMSAPDVSTGIGGSLARFTINNGTLYSVDERDLTTFDLSNPAVPENVGSVHLGWDIETIFPSDDLLFIGSRSGMHIYDGSDPLNPQHLSTFDHAQSCDPVFVKGDLAYVTLRSADDQDWCRNITNRLEIVNISNPENPTLMMEYDLSFPAGLTVTDDLLFVCEGEFGFKVFDLQPNGLLGEEVAHEPNINALDVIGLHWLDRLITIDETGLSQLSYTRTGDLSQISQIDVCQ